MEKAKDFKLLNQNGETRKLSDYKGKWIVLYFYPRDNTPGCTLEAKDFTSLKSEFEKEEAIIIGISKDSVKKHKNFVEKHDLKIELLSDEDLKVLKDYGVWQLKKIYGKESYGIVRSTFLINPEFEIVFKWEKVKTKGHAETVLEKLKELKR
ncbi:peroxiredoxin Q/BCP [Hypnocyclicus thermotrophus]|uniref:thioredoxin-dependent peroxiredoxin n=1 Tax=Hypnocyclicus thermotrophus TaxID=1627895 RepID=A0AA46E0A7_9FUSO|nr:peroxiredoxin [Hypnocyclicus thermotrophus]TDT71956.1 peroxiredoxin Q/BCP [Hypnocyclicus thermotrophus]